MINRTAILTCGGIGDACSAFVAASIIRQHQDVTIFCIARDDVWEVIDNLFKTYNPQRLPESLAENIFGYLKHGGNKEIDEIKSLYNNIICCWPDECYTSSYAFNYQEYGYTIQRLKEIRLLTGQSTQSDLIYVNLNSSTPEYQVKDPRKIIEAISLANPHKRIFLPIISTWANKKLDYWNVQVSDMHNFLNVIIKQDPPFLECLEYLKEASYVVTIDSGIYHLAHHFGKRMLLLDYRESELEPPWGMPWLVRWRYNLHDTISQDSRPATIGAIIRENLSVEQSQLLPRNMVQHLLGYTQDQPIDWKRLLFLKDF